MSVTATEVKQRVGTTKVSKNRWKLFRTNIRSLRFTYSWTDFFCYSNTRPCMGLSLRLWILTFSMDLREVNGLAWRNLEINPFGRIYASIYQHTLNQFVQACATLSSSDYYRAAA